MTTAHPVNYSAKFCLSSFVLLPGNIQTLWFEYAIYLLCALACRADILIRWINKALEFAYENTDAPGHVRSSGFRRVFGQRKNALCFFSKFKRVVRLLRRVHMLSAMVVEIRVLRETYSLKRRQIPWVWRPE